MKERINIRLLLLGAAISCFWGIVIKDATAQLAFKLYRVDRPFAGLRSTDLGDTNTYEVRRGCYYEKKATAKGKVTLNFRDIKIVEENGKKVIIHCKDDKCEKEKIQYEIDESKLNENPLYSIFAEGFDFGILALPLKIRFKTKDAATSFTTSASVGGYFGYQLTTGDVITYTIFAFGGLTTIPLNDINSPNVENATGFGTGGGIVFDLIKKFQIGVVFGVDLLGGEKGKNWPYEGKPWLSFTIGYQFVK